MIHSFTGIHGVSIVIDDATSDVHRDFSKFLYQASAGEDKLRMKSGTELQESNGNWSGTIIVTSEDDLLEFSTQTNGSIPRLLRLNGITWTKDANHSKHIKRFIMSHFGFVGKSFVDAYTKLDHKEVVALFESYEQKIDELLTERDQYTPRIVSKLAIIATTAALVEQIFSYPHFKADEIVDMLVYLERLTVVGRSIEHQALDVIKEFIVQHQFTLPRKVNLQGTERVEGSYARDFHGYLNFKNSTTLEVTLLSRVVRDVLEKHGIQQWNTVLKRWKSLPFIKKYGQDSRVSETDNILKVKAITFIFNKDDASLIQWDDRSKQILQRAPIANISYHDEEKIEEIFNDLES